jgi:hypothetical protein
MQGSPRFVKISYPSPPQKQYCYITFKPSFLYCVWRHCCIGSGTSDVQRSVPHVKGSVKGKRSVRLEDGGTQPSGTQNIQAQKRHTSQARYCICKLKYRVKNIPQGRTLSEMGKHCYRAQSLHCTHTANTFFSIAVCVCVCVCVCVSFL